MSVEDCGNVALPSWSYSISTLDTEQQDANDPASRIAALLLAKLADYVVPGGSHTCSGARATVTVRLTLILFSRLSDLTVPQHF